MWWLWSALALAAPELAVYGTCPGPLTIEVDGATPSGRVVVMTANGPGSAVLPGGPCAGAAIGLSPAGLSVRASATANAAGRARLVANVPAAACSLSLQVLDRGSCTTSEVDELEVPTFALPEAAGVTEAPSWLLRVTNRLNCTNVALNLSTADFEVAPVFRAQGSGTSLGALHAYCRVASRNGQPLQGSLLAVAERERSVVAPLGPPPAGLFDAWTAQFDLSAGTPDLPPMVNEHVTISVIDSSPTLESQLAAITTRGELPHGQVVASILNRLTCPGVPISAVDGACPVRLRTELALPLLLSSTQPGLVTGLTDLGGHTGTLSQLADAIVRAVDAVPEGLHILNVSLAWHPVHGGAIPGDPSGANRRVFAESGDQPWVPGRDPSWPIGVGAVFDALHYARCKGALVVAAAGNATSGAVGREGMLLPAAWSALQPGSLTPCSSLETGLSGSVDSVVHAVGIARDPALYVELDSPTGRPGGTPPLVAHGHRSLPVDAELRLGNLLLPVAQNQTAAAQIGVWPASGTSFSAPVVSATAAIVWGNFPTLTPEAVIDLIYEKASVTDLEAPVWTWDGWTPSLFDGHARYVRVCDTAGQIVPPGLGCMAPAVPSAAPWLTTDLPVYDAPVTLSECDGSLLSVYSRRLVGASWVQTNRPCPARQLNDLALAGGVHPQGPKDPCPVCSMRLASNQLYVDVAVHTDMTDLTVYVEVLGVPTYYPIGDQPSAAGRVIEIAGLDLSTLEKQPALMGTHIPSATAWSDSFVEVP